MDTFYSILGVDRDASAGRVREAYRELVKEHHPDVSDDAAAPDRFKRLTTAKEVLTDADERARYDRLGHATYVSQQLGSDLWDVGEREDADRSRGVSAAASEYGDSMDRSGPTARTGTPDQQTRGGTTSYGTATDYYTPGQRIRPDRASGVRAVLSRLQWLDTALFIHALLLVVALVVGAVLVVAGIVGAVPPFISAVMVVSMVGITVFVSAMHVAAQL